jgi:H+/Cl- antiporter ClcA
MTKLIFTPISIVAGLLAGLVGKKLFRGLWRVVDEQEPPQPEQRPVAIGLLVLALAIEGALFRLVKGLAEHGSRHAFSQLTGSWPGERPPDAPQDSQNSNG